MVDLATTSLFNKIYEDTFKKTLLYVTKRCRYTADIGDILQEVYTEVYSVLVKKGTSYVGNPEAFVIRVAKTKLYRYYSVLDKLRLMLPMASGQEEADVDIVEGYLAEYSLENVIVNKGLIDEIGSHIAAKPDDVRRIFYLFYYLDLTIPDIAKALRIKESAVKNKLYRTVKEVRKLYGGDGVNGRKAIVSEGN